MILHARAPLDDRYEIEEEIGRGGMAVVYRARDRRHGRPVAVKVFRTEVGTQSGQLRFLKEIQLAARLQHPHIVPIYDSGATQGLIYYVMPYVEGESLRHRLEREPKLTVQEALRITREVGEALSFAHDQGVVHRDIKPGNILLTRGGAQVADFGIARAMLEATGEERLTGPGLAIGTPSYMSPEQSGGPGAVDGRSDEYSLACVLHEMLTGSPPFSADDRRAVIGQHLLSPPPSLRASRADIPRTFDRAVRVALEKDPEDRFETVDDFVEALTEGREELFPRRRKAWGIGRAALGAAAALAVTALVWSFFAGSAPLDDGRVVVFPLADLGEPGPAAYSGADLGLWLGTAVEHVGLRRSDGWQWLDPDERARPAEVGRDRAASLARRAGARWFVTGRVQHAADSTRVLLELWDAGDDSALASGQAAGATAGLAGSRLALDAFRDLLPALLAPGDEVDLAYLENRELGAIASWIRGDAAYRALRFDSALVAYRDAVSRDSLVTLAALQGAQAASWIEDDGSAREMLGVVDARRGDLPPAHRHLAVALEAYYAGDRGAAEAAIDSALDLDPGWREGWVLRGEIERHLIRVGVDADSAAAVAFGRALAIDSTFVPAMFHLAEIATRAGELDAAERWVERARRLGGEGQLIRQVALARRCAAEGGEDLDWGREVALDAVAALEAARALAAGGAALDCAAEGFEAVIETLDPAAVENWGATVGLHAAVVALDRPPAAQEAIARAQARGLPQAGYLHGFNAALGLPADGRDAAFFDFFRSYLEEAQGTDYERTASPGGLWTLALWHAARGQRGPLERIAEALADRADAGEGGMASLASRAVAGWRALAEGDTIAAMDAFASLEPEGTLRELSWDLWRVVAPEKFKLAELAFARGDFARAGRVAAVFDHPQPIMYVQYLRRSLELRLGAARALDWTLGVERLERRLGALGGESEVEVGIR